MVGTAPVRSSLRRQDQAGFRQMYIRQWAVSSSACPSRGNARSNPIFSLKVERWYSVRRARLEIFLVQINRRPEHLSMAADLTTRFLR